MAALLPIDKPWYRQLLVISGAMGLVVGLLGLAYLGVTGKLTELVFGDPRIDAWSGDWWWVAFTAAGGLLVTALRGWWKTTDHVPGGVAVIESGEVDHRVALSWVGLAAVSAVAGASLGPSFALVMMGGGLGSWIASRRWPGDEQARLDATMAGISGGFGGAFTSPGLGTLIVSELAPIPKDRYMEGILAQLIAATAAFAVFFGAVGTTFLNSFAIPVEEYSNWQLVMGIGLGITASALMIGFVIIVKLVQAAAGKVPNRFVRGRRRRRLGRPHRRGPSPHRRRGQRPAHHGDRQLRVDQPLVARRRRRREDAGDGPEPRDRVHRRQRPPDAVRGRDGRRDDPPRLPRHPLRHRRRRHAGGRARRDDQGPGRTDLHRGAVDRSRTPHAAPVVIAVVTAHLLTAAVVAALRGRKAELPAAHA